MDPVLAIKTHKMSLNVEVSNPDRPIYKSIRKVHQAMYRDSQVKFLVCGYLPHHKLYKQLMVVSKCYIKKKNSHLRYWWPSFPHRQRSHHCAPTTHPIILRGVFETVLPYTTTSPDIPLFKKFRNNWNKIDISNITSGIDDQCCTVHCFRRCTKWYSPL